MASFPTTHWSELARGASADPEVRRAALARLLGEYVPAFRSHLAARHHLGADEIDDLVQGFVCDQVMSADLFGSAERGRGRFRALLVTALDRYVMKSRRYQRAQKRRVPSDALSLDAIDGEPAGRMPDAAASFDVAWARQVIDRALTLLREEFGSPERERTWAVFERRVLGPALGGADAPPYEVIAAELGFDSAAQAANALVTAKRSFSRILRAIVGEYAADEGEIGAELNELWAILSKAGARGAGSCLPG